MSETGMTGALSDVGRWQRRALALLHQSEAEFEKDSTDVPRGGILRVLPHVARAGVLAQQAHAYAALALAESYRLEQETRDRGAS